MLKQIFYFVSRLRLFYDPSMNRRQALQYFINDLKKPSQHHIITDRVYDDLDRTDRLIIEQSVKSYRRKGVNNRELASLNNIYYSPDTIQSRRRKIGDLLLENIVSHCAVSEV